MGGMKAMSVPEAVAVLNHGDGEFGGRLMHLVGADVLSAAP
jgi:hypothetical protein